MTAVHRNCPGCAVRFEVMSVRKDGQVTCPSCGRIFHGDIPASSLWYVARENQKIGPLLFTELKRLVLEAKLKASELILRADSTKWVEAGGVAGLFEPPAGAKVALPIPMAITAADHRQPNVKNALSAIPAVTPGTKPEPAASVPMPSASDGPSFSPKSTTGSRVFREIGAAISAPFAQAFRIFRYAIALRRMRFLNREHHHAQLAFGQGLYDAGAGDNNTRLRIAVLNGEICRLDAMKQSTTTARAERDQLLIQMAEQVDGQPIADRNLGAARQRVMLARTALRECKDLLARLKQNLFPHGAAEWLRFVAGSAAMCAVILLLCWTTISISGWRRAPNVITDINQDDKMVQTVGWVITGRKVTLPDGVEIEEPMSGGSCFAISADGYLLTNKHVVKNTWELLNVPARKKAIEEWAKARSVAAIPMVWVFFGRNESYRAQIIHVSPDYDIAILKIERVNVSFFRISTLDCPQRGTKVVAFGFPGVTRDPLTEGEERFFRQERVNLAIQAGKRVRIGDHFDPTDFEFNRTNGTVTRPVETNESKWIQHEATIHHGNSGGPLLSEDGLVVGINTLGNTKTHGVYRALSMPQLRKEIERHVAKTIWR